MNYSPAPDAAPLTAPGSTPPPPPLPPPPPPWGEPPPPSGPGAAPAQPLFWLRVAAYLVDSLVLVGIYAILVVAGLVVLAGVAAASELVAGMLAVAGLLALWAVPIVYGTVLLARYGRTPGKAAVGLRVVQAATGARPSLGQALGRTVLFALLGVIALIGLTHGTRDGYHDLAANTRVVRG